MEGGPGVPICGVSLCHGAQPAPFQGSSYRFTGDAPQAPGRFVRDARLRTAEGQALTVQGRAIGHGGLRVRVPEYDRFYARCLHDRVGAEVLEFSEGERYATHAPWNAEDELLGGTSRIDAVRYCIEYTSVVGLAVIRAVRKIPVIEVLAIRRGTSVV